MTNPGSGGGSGECRWLDGGLQGLLDDPEGVQLLKQFMEVAWPRQARAFDFYFAVRGLRAKQEQGYSDKRCRRVVLAIDRRYIRREEHLPISAAARQSIQERLQAGDDCDAGVFDSAMQEVAQFLAHRVYPSFARWWGERGAGSGFELATSSAAAAAAAADIVGGASSSAARNARASSVPRSRSCHGGGGGGSLDLTSHNLMATVRERGAAAAFTADCAGLGRAGLALPYYVGNSLSAASLPDSLPQTASLSSDALTTTTSDTQSLLTDTGSGSLGAARAAVATRQRRRAAAAAAAAATAGPPQAQSSSVAACDAASNPSAFAQLLSDKLQHVLLQGQAPVSASGDSSATQPAVAAKAASSLSPLQQPLPQPPAAPARDLLNEPWARRIIGRVLQSSSADTPEQILDRHVHEVLDQRASAPHSMSDPNLLVQNFVHVSGGA